MTVVCLKDYREARQAAVTRENERTPSPEAISMALRYLQEDARELGEEGLARMMKLAALDAPDPFLGEGRLPAPDPEDRIPRVGSLMGLGDCLGRLVEEARAANEPVMADLIRHAHAATLRRVGRE